MADSLLEKLQKEGLVPLEKYGHQVGGHHLLLQYRDTLCKPVRVREHFFYQTAPEILKRYLPSYRGVIDVSYKSDSSGDIIILASPKPHLQPSTSPLSLKQKGNTALKCTTGKTIHENDSMVTTSHHTGNGEDYKNPWSIHCSRIMEENLKELEYLDKVTEEYLVLENLSSKFQCPSVLDLKIGTRQHGDDTPPEKISKHKHTCSVTTSGSIGVRMAGLQLFNDSKKEYTFRDKYFGKKLSIADLSQALCSFLNNGVVFRSDLLSPLIRMLEDIRITVCILPSYRYYSSSLVLIYDGSKSDGCPLSRIDMDTLLDDIIKETTPISETTPVLADDATPTSAVNGDLDSIRNGAVITIPSPLTHTPSCTTSSEGISTNHTPPCVMTSDDPPQDNHTPSSFTMTSSSEATPISHTPSLMSSEDLARARSHIDVRMIDFAHSTHPGYEDPILYDGVDEGYLLGLDSLIRIFRNINTAFKRNGRGV